MIQTKQGIVYHISAGGYVVHKNKILLVKSLYHQGIVPPHGHQEKGEKLIETAKREICEETGYCDLQPITKISVARYSYFHLGKRNIKTEHRWLFQLSSLQVRPKKTKEAEMLRNRWYTLAQAEQRATFENSKQDIRIIRTLLGNSQQAKEKEKKKKSFLLP